ncbi:hypothetical protein [uncultured Shewanella sp.]|uniref:hypothetical protein n=1 Tax=uncultured Shewanella sp. TaxID=173975 RepID=UPI0026389DF4|nr:hypothetical protein [uncultured Shewanella sp.]
MKWMPLVLLVGVLFSLSATGADFDVMYDKGNSKVLLTEDRQLTERKLDEIGKSLCSSNRFCVLWFYHQKSKAQKGAEVMKKGDMFAVTPGMYAIFSKNKINNKIICYEPLKGC